MTNKYTGGGSGGSSGGGSGGGSGDIGSRKLVYTNFNGYLSMK
jgi:hypothetical protein